MTAAGKKTVKPEALSKTTGEEGSISAEARVEFPTYKKVPVNQLVPYARNARTHSDEQIGQIMASIREFGWTTPILIDGDKGIIAGHGRLLAAQRLGIKTVPVIERTDLTEAQKRAYVIADNKLALDAGWDYELLRIEFQELGDLGFDLALTGFDAGEMGNIMLDGSSLSDPPEDFKEVGDAELSAICPKCGFEFDA